MKRLLTYCSILILWIACICNVNAQEPCDVPGYVELKCFQAPAKACVGMQINITRIGCPVSGSSVQPLYCYDYAHNPNQDTTITHWTYTAPGTYIIHQWYVNYCDSTSQPIIIVASPDPVFTVQSCVTPQRNVIVTITDTVYDLFQINYGNGVVTPPLSKAVSPVEYAYPTDGNYSITVQG
ncbi:MAG: hypothetical protein H7259_10340, partial [Cytophagales bacterium]|nr:hypothetical protein [Cytophaga sp.]